MKKTYGNLKKYELYSWNTNRKIDSNKYNECKVSFYVEYEKKNTDEELI